MEEKGYGSMTIQNYVIYINKYLDYVGASDIRFNRGKGKDISGMTFGYLTAMEPTDKREYNSIVWRCQCVCGNEVDVSYNNLMYANQISCGCRKKEHDQKLQSFLTHVAGTSVDILKSKKIPTNNTTGVKGVYYINGKYVAKIVFQKKQYLLGTYENIADAAEARKEAEEVLCDGVAEHYRQWKKLADQDSAWAEEHPIQIIVRLEDKKLHVTMLPNLAPYESNDVAQHN